MDDEGLVQALKTARPNFGAQLAAFVAIRGLYSHYSSGVTIDILPLLQLCIFVIKIRPDKQAKRHDE